MSTNDEQQDVGQQAAEVIQGLKRERGIDQLSDAEQLDYRLWAVEIEVKECIALVKAIRAERQGQ